MSLPSPSGPSGPPTGVPPPGGLAPNPNYLQGSATAAFVWVLYDIGLTWDRELESVWRASWSVSKVLFLFSRYHTIAALSFFLMEAIGTKHFALPINVDTSNIPAGSPFYAPCIANLKYSIASRGYLAMTEIVSIMAGEFLILIRINAVYGWSRRIVAVTLFVFAAETVIGLTTTILALTGGAKGLFGSSNILTCAPHQANIPDVNVAMWCTSMIVVGIYLTLIVYKARDVQHVVRGRDGRTSIQSIGILAAFKSTRMSPTLHICLRDAAIYFAVIFCVLLVNLTLIVAHDAFAQMGTAWLLATYSVASTRIFLNLKALSTTHLPFQSESSWAHVQQNTSLDFIQLQSRASTLATGKRGSARIPGFGSLAWPGTPVTMTSPGPADHFGGRINPDGEGQESWVHPPRAI